MTTFSATYHKWRSLLFIPANNKKFIDAAATRGADAIILDLEDSIPLAHKAEARRILPAHIEALYKQNVDVIVRINGDIMNAVADLDVAVSQYTAAIIVSKVLGADHIVLLDNAISLLESQRNITQGSIKLIALIETISAMESATVIAQSSPRLIGLALGTEDLSLDGGFEPTPENLTLPAQKIIYAARIANVNAYGFPASIADYSDIEKFTVCQQRAKSMGFNGALCIHPQQVQPINEAYALTEDERDQAEKIIIAYDKAIKNNQGVVELDGKMIDAPVVGRARKSLL
jgi:citrate lyase subunit beta/citryl-CoA lyase